MVVAQLVELTTPEVRRSNPVIGKKIVVNVYCQLYWKDENKEKEAGIGSFKKCSLHNRYCQSIANKSVTSSISCGKHGGGCGTVGRAVASNTRVLQFESSHRQFYLLSTVLNKLFIKDENKEKRGWEWQFFKKTSYGETGLQHCPLDELSHL